MEIRQKLLCLSVALLSSCSTLDNSFPPITSTSKPNVDGLIITELASIGEPERKPSLAVYLTSFTDLTGQRTSRDNFATFSTAITQAPYTYLIYALTQSNFFNVVERIGLDNLTRERQIIRSTREGFSENQEIMPLSFAGLIVEGGVVSYETSNLSGGTGARYLGIGLTKQYRQDVVTVSLRTVSVSTGKVMTDVLVTKSILSVAIDQNIFRFIANNTELVEIENGRAENESVSIALRAAIETAVLETINIGLEQGYWRLQ
jgi:curli production assembly/transport component CsgG